MKSRLAGNIARSIEDSGLSLAEIARQMGGTFNPKTISRWRDAETTPSQANLAKFAVIVGQDDLTWFYLPHDEVAA